MKRTFTIFTYSVLLICAAGHKAAAQDLVPVAFDSLSRERITGSVESFRLSEELPSYSDRNWKNILRTAGVGIFGISNVRGENFTVLVDGLPRDGSEDMSSFSDKINAEQIESITILKDVASRMLYGAMADKPILMIKTKRGTPGRQTSQIRYESSFGIPVSYPSYLGTADYMILYNEALKNDGLATKYSYEDIEEARSATDGILYPQRDYYTDTFLNKFKPQTRVATSFDGGNDIARYHLNLSWYNTHSIIKMGEALNQQTNCLNASGNVDINIGRYVTASLDATAIFNSYQGVNYLSKNFWRLSTTERINNAPFLIPIDEISDDCADIVQDVRNQRSVINGNYILGGNTSFTQNIYGDLLLGGYSNTMDRFAQVDIALDTDMSFLTGGLRFKTYFGSDNYNCYTLTQNNTYAVYDAVLRDDGKYDITKIGVNDFIGTQSISDVHFYRRFGWYNTLSYKRVFGDRHDIDILANTIALTYKESGSVYSARSFNAGLRANYMYDGRYTLEYGSALIGSPRFAKSHRWGYAWSLGAGWIIRNDDSAYLKASASLGMGKTDIDEALSSYHLFENVYSRGSEYSYADGAGSNYLMNITAGSGSLGWIRKRDIDIALEGSLMSGALSFGLDLYHTLRYDEPVRRTNTLPAYIGGSRFLPLSPYGRHSTMGVELSGTYRLSRGDWRMLLRGKVLWYSPRIIRYDEPEYDASMHYYRRTGKATDAIWGLSADGFYTSDDIDAISAGTLPKPAYGVVREGDIKYKDLNGDNVIDDFDYSVLGYSHVRFNYGLNIEFGWKQFTLRTYLFAQTGASRMWNGDYYATSGESKYPTHLVYRWAYDPATGVDTRDIARYPRLTTGANTHNSNPSSFWIGSLDYFSIPMIQLTYTFARSGHQVFVKGSDLLMVGPDVDKVRLNIGSEPQYRTFSAGVTLMIK